jgi:transketolase
MHTFLLMAGFFTIMVFFLIDKNLLPGTSIARKHILGKLEKNKKREMQLQAEFENLVASYGAWSHNAFPDSDVTYSEYIELLKEKSNIEYSDSEFKKLKSKLKRKQVREYIEKIKNQEEAVIALQADLDCQKKNLQSLHIASAS